MELVRRFGKDAAWLRERTGIAELRRLGPAETVADLAVTAARAALADSGQTVVDLVVVASCSMKPGPQLSCEGPGSSLAAQVAMSVAPGALVLDLNAACAGFVYALSAAADLIRAGTVGSALVIGAEQMSTLIDPDDLGTSILFADGAGAAVLSTCSASEDGFGTAAYYSDGTSCDVLVIPPGSTTLSMDGQAVFRWAVSTVPDVIEQALKSAGICASDVEVFIPHQANARITDAIRRRAGLDHTITADNVRLSGNTSAASIPIALDALRMQEDIAGKLAVIVGFGAGLSCAAQVLRLP